MPGVPERTGGVSLTVLLITLGFILIGSLASGLLGPCEPFLVLGLMLLIGLPHGATDHGLFLILSKGHPAGKQVNFYLLYTLVIAVYGLLWYIMPLIAFVIFLVLSVYHFGQSNWADVTYERSSFGRGHYLLWGCGVLLTPILLHGGEAASIVAEMTNHLLVVPEEFSVLAVIALLAVANLLYLLVCRHKRIISRRRLLKEVVGYGLLMTMFFTNSLLLGFTVYFVFWHSLASAKDQVRFFQRQLSPAVRRQLYFGILTTVGGSLLFCFVIWFGPGLEAALQPSIIGGVFIFISLLTLPHMLLVETLYSQWSPATEDNRIPLSANPRDKEVTFQHVSAMANPPRA